MTSYADIERSVGEFGFIVRGAFDDSDGKTVVIIGNTAADMWTHFDNSRRSEPDPLDAWTRRCLQPIASTLGAEFVHPSDEPFAPFQRWAQMAEAVWPSPIGLLIHPRYGLWHAYRGAFVFPATVELVGAKRIASPGVTMSPCLSCTDQPCLSACPVGAFTAAGYEASRCRQHVSGSLDPDCLHAGCAARLACPVGVDQHYGADQMLFHMRAFVGLDP